MEYINNISYPVVVNYSHTPFLSPLSSELVGPEVKGGGEVRMLLVSGDVGSTFIMIVPLLEG